MGTVTDHAGRQRPARITSAQTMRVKALNGPGWRQATPAERLTFQPLPTARYAN